MLLLLLSAGAVAFCGGVNVVARGGDDEVVRSPQEPDLEGWVEYTHTMLRQLQQDNHDDGMAACSSSWTGAAAGICQVLWRSDECKQRLEHLGQQLSSSEREHHPLSVARALATRLAGELYVAILGRDADVGGAQVTVGALLPSMMAMMAASSDVDLSSVGGASDDRVAVARIAAMLCSEEACERRSMR
jgi:hypothetical protein